MCRSQWGCNIPFYLYHCPNGHDREVFLPVSEHRATIECTQCELLAEQIITVPVMVKAAQDVCYDSPIDGRPITSWHQRMEDLKRHDCVPYDPGMKEDYARRQVEDERRLDASIEQHVEASIERMPTAQRGQLWNEITRAGVDAVVERRTAE